MEEHILKYYIAYDKHSNLNIGETYEVEFDDCCIVGTFTSKLTAMIAWAPQDPNDLYPEELHFENGVVLREWRQCYFDKIDQSLL